MKQKYEIVIDYKAVIAVTVEAESTQDAIKSAIKKLDKFANVDESVMIESSVVKTLTLKEV